MIRYGFSYIEVFYPNNAGYCFNINNLLESMVATSRSCCPILVPNGRRFRGRTSALGPGCVKFEDMRCSWEIGEFLRYPPVSSNVAMGNGNSPRKNMELSTQTSSISRYMMNSPSPCLIFRCLHLTV